MKEIRLSATASLGHLKPGTFTAIVANCAEKDISQLNIENLGTELSAWFRQALSVLSKKRAPELFPCAVGKDGSCHVGFYNLANYRQMPIDEGYRTIGARIISDLKTTGGQLCRVHSVGEDAEEFLPQIGEGILLGSYEFDRYRKSEAKERASIELIAQPQRLASLRKQLEAIRCVTDAQNFVRDLVNEPPASMGPKRFIAEAQALARECELKFQVLLPPRLEKEGYHGILAVGRGADEAPAMLILRYQAKKRTAPTVALVGKAVMFDAGGYCLKQAKDMWHMKGDMAGGAAVLGAMRAVASLGAPVNVLGIIPCAKNLISAGAYVPGDVIRFKNGKTVHVTNTDAEGRLLLADALIRAGEEKASVIVDVATLTGSVVRALGPAIAGVMGNHRELVEAIIDAGQKVGEAFWELPLVEEYKAQLKSAVADLDNVGQSPNAGAIIGGLFLQEFVPTATPWAHLDIAGPFLTEKPWRYYSPGATGFATRTLIRWVREESQRLSN